jgi:hypothetical protein
MPIVYRVDHARRLIVAQGRGTVTEEDVFGHQRSIGFRRELDGFDELIDMSPVSEIIDPKPARVRDLATFAADLDAPGTRSKFAIVAPSDVAFGLGRMFQAQRSHVPHSRKEVGVFRTMAEALAFLGLDGPVEMPKEE